MLLIAIVIVTLTIYLTYGRFTRDASGERKANSGNTSYNSLFVAGASVPYVPSEVADVAEMDCWAQLIQRESNFRVNATNPTSGAYGIPQSLPPDKMATMGDDWRTNSKTQLKWMHKYVLERYGGFCKALATHTFQNWY